MTTVGDHAVPATRAARGEPATPATHGEPATRATDGEPVEGYAVVYDDTGPVATVDASGEPAPAVIVPADLPVAELADSPVLTVLDAYPELPGFVVIAADGALVGVLPVGVLDDYLGAGGFVPSSKTMGPVGGTGDLDVPGDPRLPIARIRCQAAGCGYVNALAFLDLAHPPTCGNPDLAAHALAVRGV